MLTPVAEGVLVHQSASIENTIAAAPVTRIEEYLLGLRLLEDVVDGADVAGWQDVLSAAA